MATKRQRIRNKELEALKAEFRDLLVPCLKKCARGRWGLFGAHDRIIQQNSNLSSAVAWPEAKKLRELASSIRTTLAHSGERDNLCDEFLRLCDLHKANDPGEPKLASSFLKEIENIQPKEEKV